MRSIRILIPALLFALAGCTQGDANGVATVSGGSAAPTTTASVDPAEAGRRFAQCMRDNGVPDFPDPEPGQSRPRFQVFRGADGDKTRKAMDKCRELLPDGGERQRAPSAAELEEARAFARCMRDNGVPDFPDPDPNGGGLRIGPGAGGRAGAMTPDDPEFKSAMEACEDKLPRLGGGR